MTVALHYGRPAVYTVEDSRRRSADRTVMVAGAMKAAMTMVVIVALVASIVFAAHSGALLWAGLAILVSINAALIGRVCSGARGSALDTLQALNSAHTVNFRQHQS